ncbi:MAG: hypothetical protein VR65_20045 [Desulfobulbaceae bacterium BRH_c16a]|nr:MAG: hypothetical protein VR65_20045 [Desulfobulbaceae bacterium BRH_c16a]
MFDKIAAILNRSNSAGKILPSDELDVTVQAATKVYCVHCRQHIYYLKKADGGVAASNLAPLQGGRTPVNFGCPACGQDIRAYAPEPTLKTDKGYLNKGR